MGWWARRREGEAVEGSRLSSSSRRPNPTQDQGRETTIAEARKAQLVQEGETERMDPQ